MTPRPKLGYLVPRFPGQTQTNCWSEIAALEELGADVAIFSTRPPPAALMPHDWGRAAVQRTTWLDGVSPAAYLRAVAALPYGLLVSSERGLARDILRAVPAAVRLRSLCARAGLHHVHVHGCGQGAMIAALAERMGGPSYSIALPGPLSEGGPGQNFKWRRARFGLVATARILNEIRFVLREDLPRTAVCPLGVDTAFRRDQPYRPARPGEEIVLFSCGRLDPAKGFQDLMKSVRLLLDRGQPVRLAIAGQDDRGGAGYRRDLDARAAELRLGAHVEFLGAVDAAEIRARMIAAHILVLPSWQEPIGTTLMEAMACGLPVIGTAAGGVRELVTDGRDGILVQPKSPEALTAAILRIAGNPELARSMSLQARSRVEAGFDARHGAERILREVGLLPGGHDADLIPDLPRTAAPPRARR